MAIGSPDQAARLDQLRTYARVQVRSGYKGDDEVRLEVYDAVLDEVRDADRAEQLTQAYLGQARSDLARAAAQWPHPPAFERLQAAFGELRAEGVIVLEACDDHWAANETLHASAADGSTPRGIAFFTHADVWHAVEHDMFELNVWHGDTANVREGDDLVSRVQQVLGDHGIESQFDEGRLEVSLTWQ
ncbi:MAG: hypothetical protein H0T17_08475, partial [Propionibacteriales bacterium]|nr:hypothetical protein [Propionibacteriales bacterium]